MSNLAIMGAGGHGKVVADCAIKSGKYRDIVFLDARHLSMENVLGLPVIGDDLAVPTLIDEAFEFIVTIGDNAIRQRVFCQLAQSEAKLATIVHPSAVLSKGVTVKTGSVVLAHATINADALIGHNVIVNTGAIIEHDCMVENHVHCAPNCTITGGVKIGSGTLVGTSATIIPNKIIGKECIIGAGAVVVKDIPDNTLATGIPASW